MRRVERQVIRQPSRPSDSLPVPRSHRQRVTRGGDSLEQRARQQRQLRRRATLVSRQPRSISIARVPWAT